MEIKITQPRSHIRAEGKGFISHLADCQATHRAIRERNRARRKTRVRAQHRKQSSSFQASALGQVKAIARDTSDREEQAQHTRASLPMVLQFAQRNASR